jgi:hypothetical protein
MLGIDGLGFELALERCFNDRFMWHFDREVDHARFGPDCTREPGGNLGQPHTSMGKVRPAEVLSVTIGGANAVLLECSVHRNDPAFESPRSKPVLVRVSRRNPSYWASARGNPPGTVPYQVFTKKIEAHGAVGCSRRVGSVHQATNAWFGPHGDKVRGGELGTDEQETVRRVPSLGCRGR